MTDSLSDRREAAKERVLRKFREDPDFIHKLQQGFAPNTVAAAVGGKRGRVDYRRSASFGYAGDQPASVGFNMPAVVRTSQEQKIASLIGRIKDSPPAMQEAIIQRLAGEYWKAGMPVTGEALRAAATSILTKRNNTRKPY